ncbi:D-alanyl-D-alanine carboxypeptidase family protein [Collinsella provencensis]|uniref:D-alanyl-D-alanine carboxypeptidase family protein n=1 Tax=Collinsella provencensis TaxID=1937461 RepID=UPI001F2D7834|nr:D-alanyl-D-alanine carboxypeptidase family protein [Collinsella provencensis]
MLLKRTSTDCRTVTLRILALSLATALAIAASPVPALGEVRTSDIILGKTAEERGIDASELPDLVCPHAMLMTQDGTVLFERDADAPIRIASTTKVMTALLALENCELTDIVTVDHAAATVGESNVKLQEGDTLTMEEALTGLMVHSGNDAAMAIATTVGAHIDPSSNNPFQTFVDAMNKRAQELGCTDTLFENPHGLDFNGWEGDLHSTARDILTIYAAAMKNDDFRRINNSDRTDMHVTSADGTERTVELTVRNEIQGQQGNIGGKTGSTYEAKRCFVGAFSRENGGEVYVAVFGDETSEERFGDTLALANWYYDHLAEIPLVNTNATYGGKPLVAEATCLDWTDKTVRVTADNPDATVSVFSLAGPLEQSVDLKDYSGTVKRGASAGAVTYTQDGVEVGSVELVTAEPVEEPTLFDSLMIQFDRLIRFFKGEPSTAESSVYCEAPDPLACDNWNPEE